jgi:rSAM/selenodomain-associated transferase 1
MNVHSDSTAGRPVVVIMTRWPAEGRCKRRLSKALGANRAAAIQQRLTSHTLSVVRSLEQNGQLHMRLALAGCGRRAAQRWIGRPRNAVALQGEGGLGERLRRQLVQTHRHHRHSAILLIGSDLPGLESGDLLAAIEALRQKPLVLGPASDGGYWLLGLHPSLLNPVVSWPFSAIPWGSSTVLQVTRERAQTHGITPRLLRTRHDLDRLDDLVAWLGPHSHH